MTIGDKLISMSSLATASAMSHLLSALSRSGSSMVPVQDIISIVDINEYAANADINITDADISVTTYDADIAIYDKSLNIDNTTIAGDIKCA